MRGNSAEEVAERVLSQTSIWGLQVIIRNIITSNNHEFMIFLEVRTVNVLCVVLGAKVLLCVRKLSCIHHISCGRPIVPIFMSKT